MKRELSPEEKDRIRSRPTVRKRLTKEQCDQIHKLAADPNRSMNSIALDLDVTIYLLKQELTAEEKASLRTFRPGNPTHLTKEETAKICEYYKNGKTPTEISAIVKRSVASVYKHIGESSVAFRGRDKSGLLPPEVKPQRGPSRVISAACQFCERDMEISIRGTDWANRLVAFKHSVFYCNDCGTGYAAAALVDVAELE